MSPLTLLQAASLAAVGIALFLGFTDGEPAEVKFVAAAALALFGHGVVYARRTGRTWLDL